MLQRLADAMQADPSRAPAIAVYMLTLLEGVPNGVPPGYVYHGAHKLVSRIRDLEPPLLDGAGVANSDVPLVLQLGMGLPGDQIKVPFDCIVIGVGGRAAPVPVETEDQAIYTAQVGMVPEFSQAGRSLFAVSWNLDGVEEYATDGRSPQLAPAVNMIGTQALPRALYWELQRNQRIVVSYKSLMSTAYGPPELMPDGFVLPNINADVCFYVLNIESP